MEEGAKEVTKKVTSADIEQQQKYQQGLDTYNAIQQAQNKGRLVIDPNAARELPQSEGARILAMGRSGIALLNGTTPEFPFAAYAQQHLPNVQPSLNSKLMEQTLGKYMNEGKADPRVEDSLHKMVSNDLLPDAYALGQKYPHEFADILNGYVKNPEQEKDYLKFKNKADAIQTLRDNSLLLPEFLKKLDGDSQKNGLVISPELQKSISDYYDYMNGTIGKANMEESAIQEQKQLLDKLHGYSALDEMVKKVLPDKGSVLKETQVAPATYTDKNGKQVPIANAFAENNYENPDTQQLKDDLTKRSNLILDGAGDDEKSALAKQLGTKKDDESIRSGLINYMYSLLPKGGNTTLHREAPVNIRVGGEDKKIGQVYQGTQTIKYGSQEGGKQYSTDVDNYTMPETTFGIGNVGNVIPETGTSGQSVNLGENTKAENIIVAPMTLVDGKLTIVDKDSKESAKNLFYAPMVVAQRPKTEQVPIDKDDESKGTKTRVVPDTFETFYVPLNQVANVLRGKASSNAKGEEMDASIKLAYDEAQERNSADSKGTGQSDFEKHFSMTDYEITKKKGEQSKVKEKDRVKSGAIY